MSPILPLHAPYIHQPEVRLVDQRGRLDGVLRALVVQMPPRNPVQFGICQVDDLPDGCRVPGAPGSQKFRDLRRWRRGHEVPLYSGNYSNQMSGAAGSRWTKLGWTHSPVPRFYVRSFASDPRLYEWRGFMQRRYA